MSQLADRIAQFRKMAGDDPDNELGHFRLGQLLMEDNQFADAARSFQRTLVLSPTFSKVYQLLAQCQLKLERRDEAIGTLKEGCKVADARGDKMPRDAMGEMLKELGVEAPATSAKAADAPRAGDFQCHRPNCIGGGYGQQLKAPPVPDPIGLRIYQEICADCWTDWFKNYSVKVINELRLDLSTEHGTRNTTSTCADSSGSRSDADSRSAVRREPFHAEDVVQIDSDAALVVRLSRFAGQSDVSRAEADPEQVGVADVEADAIGHHESERLEGLFAECVAEFVGGHE